MAPVLKVVGTTVVRYEQNVTSVPLPTGTRRGDLIVVSAWAQEGWTFGMSDARLTQAVADVGYGHGGIWTGKADGSGNAIGLTMIDDSPDGSPYSCAVVAVFRSRIVGDIATVVGQASPTIPSLPRRAAIAVQFSGYSFVDGWATLPSGWTFVVSPPTGKAHASVMYWTGDAPSPSTTWTMTGNVEAERCGMAVFGAVPMTFEAPMCRKFPVEPVGRHFPPPKSQQRSGRRFGHY